MGENVCDGDGPCRTSHLVTVPYCFTEHDIAGLVVSKGSERKERRMRYQEPRGERFPTPATLRPLRGLPDMVLPRLLSQWLCLPYTRHLTDPQYGANLLAVSLETVSAAVATYVVYQALHKILFWGSKPPMVLVILFTVLSSVATTCTMHQQKLRYGPWSF